MDPGSLLLILLLVVAGGVAFALLGGGGMFRSGKADPHGGDDDGPRPTHTVVRDESDSGRAHGPGD
jgi:hypothetical protein